jgi:hypothetical protein
LMTSSSRFVKPALSNWTQKRKVHVCEAYHREKTQRNPSS